MVTNEELISNLPENALQALETSSAVDSFEGNFDGQNRWLLRTPFDGAQSGIAPGMIARVARSGFSQSPAQTFVVVSVSISGFTLRSMGQPENVGQGPGAIYGIETVRVKILDMTAVLEQARITVESRFGSVLADDPDAMSSKSEAIREIAIARAFRGTEFFAAYCGSKDGSPPLYDQRILDRLASDLLIRLSKLGGGGGMSWPRVRR